MINIKKFNELNENEILAKADVVINNWHDHFFSGKLNIDRKKIEMVINDMYKSLKLKMPNIKFAKDLTNSLSLKELSITEKEYEVNVFDQYIENILDKISDSDANIIKSIKNDDLIININNKSYNVLEHYINIFNLIKYDEVIKLNLNTLYDKYKFIILYDLFIQLGIIESEEFLLFKNFVLSGIFALITTKNNCIIYENPDKITLDENKRLHNETSASLIYNKYIQYNWHNVEIDKFWIENKESITKSTIVNEKNAEKKRCLKEILGSKNFANLLNIIVIDEDIDNKGNPVKLFKTVDKDEIAEDYLYFANVICPSTGREYFISVPQMDNVWSAVAYTFKMNKEEYKLTEES